jgi:hypothetical protein
VVDEQAPEPLQSYHRVGCNEPVAVYRGPGALVRADGTSHGGPDVEIAVDWFPVPRVAVRARLPELAFPWSDDLFSVELPVGLDGRNGFPLTILARLVGVTVDVGDETVVELVATEPVVLGPADPPAAAWAAVHLVNCHNFLGDTTIQERGGGYRSLSRTRITIENPSWKATLDADVQADDLLREAMLRAGFAVTHVARVEAQGRFLTPELAQEVADELGQFLSLATGSAVGVFGISGYGPGDKELWSIWPRPRARPYEGSGFCPLPRAAQSADGFRPPDLSQMSARFVALRQDNGTSLTRLRRWYLGALHAEPATSVVLSGAGLELLTHWHLVGEQGLSAAGFDRLSAADRLRLLLSAAAVSASIPATLPGLRSLAAERAARKQEADGPWCVAEFRNGVVHPPNRLRREHADDADLLAEASELARWYLDLAVLRLLDYRGAYRDRLTPGHPARAVPWASSGEQPLVSALP